MRLLRRCTPRNDRQLYLVRINPKTNYDNSVSLCEPDEGGRGNPSIPS
jgi:hypothetical protein